MRLKIQDPATDSPYNSRGIKEATIQTHPLTLGDGGKEMQLLQGFFLCALTNTFTHYFSKLCIWIQPTHKTDWGSGLVHGDDDIQLPLLLPLPSWTRKRGRGRAEEEGSGELQHL